MEEYGMKMPSSQFFHTSSDDISSSLMNTLNLGNDDGASGSWSLLHHHHQIPHSSSSSSIDYYFHHNNNNNNNNNNDMHALMQQQKRPRGRPIGSKNKPKQQSFLFTQQETDVDDEEEMNSMVIEVAPGFDVMEALVNYATLRNVGISVLSASGTIASVTLRHLIPHTHDFSLHGPFTLLSITGTFICGHHFNPNTLILDETASSVSSSSVINLSDHPFNSANNAFGITLLGSQGEIVGGIVAGKVVASSNNVVVTALVFKNPDFFKVRSNENE